MKSGSPSRTTAAHKTQTKNPGLVLSRLPLLSLLLLFLPKLLRGTRDRWVAQVSFIIIYSTGLAPFPRLSAPPHSSQYAFDSNHSKKTILLLDLHVQRLLAEKNLLGLLMALEFEIETPNLLWYMLGQSSIGVPYFITFPQAVIWATTDKEEENLTDKAEFN